MALECVQLRHSWQDVGSFHGVCVKNAFLNSTGHAKFAEIRQRICVHLAAV